MGIHFFDYYSFSHFVGGMILQRMGLSRIVAYSLHIFFELFENYIYVPYFGGRCISIPYILPITDCKTKPDSLINMVSDQIFFMIGFEFAKLINIKYIPMLPNYFIWFIPILPSILSLITTNIIGKTPKYEMK